MVSRPLHAVLLPHREAVARLLDLLPGALHGDGPALLPLDPALPRTRLDALIRAFAPTSIEPAGDLPAASAGVAEDIAVVLATSGSTGRPKGAELSAAALLAAARASTARLGGRPGEPWLCCLPVHHVSGLGILVRSLLSGTEPLVSDRADAAAMSQAAGGYASLVPTQLGRLLDAGAPLAGLRAILLGGAAIPDGMLDRAAAAGARVVTSYGMTETCGGCVYDGVPLDGVRVGQHADGRITIGGPVLFSGYRLAPELTRAALTGSWFVTSDLGGLDDHGRLVVHGRADDVIITGGENVVAADVERALRRCPGVLDVAVVGTPDLDWGERVTAVVVAATQGIPPDLDSLRAQVRATLPRHAAPQAMLLVQALPMLASGKPDRQQLRDMASQARHAG